MDPLTLKAFSIRNPLDKNYYLPKKMGFDELILSKNAYNTLIPSF